VQTLLRLAGTPHWPDLSGHVVLLEATPGTSPSQLHAQLTQLGQTGPLGSAAAVGFGRFGSGEGLDLPGVLDGLLADVLAHDPFDGPVVCGLDFGHTDPVFCVPYGVRTELAADERTGVTLEFPEAAVSDGGTPPS
jgi:muramoyltetrapeptide carboxypeptidase